MRAHHRSTTDKFDQIEQQTSPSAKPSSPLSSSLSRTQVTPCVTASPTSVIVPRLGIDRDQKSLSSAFSAIIRHTRTNHASTTITAAKHPCRDETSGLDETEKHIADSVIKDPEYVSKMVIRTSVISPNPEHLLRFENNVKSSSNTFDYPDPTRSSAFTRSNTMTLNLAIA